MYRIKNWKEFQHYKTRNPPWIKLHFTTLSSEDWVMLDNDSRVLAIACMLIASRHEGCVPNNPEYIQRLAYLDKKPDFSNLLKIGFLVDDTLKEKESSKEKEKTDKDTYKEETYTEQQAEDATCKQTLANACNDELQEVIAYLNEQADKNYRLTSKSKYLPMMKKILKEYGIEKMKRACYLQVLDCKDDPKIEQFMHPSTLFRNFENFDRALNKSEEAIKMKKFKTNPKRTVYIEPNKKELY